MVDTIHIDVDCDICKKPVITSYWEYRPDLGSYICTTYCHGKRKQYIVNRRAAIAAASSGTPALIAFFEEKHQDVRVA